MQIERRFSSPPATKFALPKVSPLFVPRSRLTARLKNSLSRKLTIISSPAGFGKTSLVADWLKDRPEDFVWIQMHDDDNDPVRFFSSLIAGLRYVHQGFGATILDAMHSIGSPPVEDIVNLIAQELEAVSRETILVFDDLHIIQRRDIYRILERLLQLLPLQIHLFFISRKDPPLSISKLRVDRQLNELRAPDLSFTPAETRDLLIDKMKIPLSDNSIETLFNVTEGWIAGLQMAVLSIRKRTNADDFIAGLNGTARDIFDYLDEEVLSRQPANVRQFLMETSILGSFNASLCEALTGQKNAADMLREFEAANLFIFPLDDYRQWYRYHGFFADGLRQRLTASFGDSRIAELHALASRWYYENGDPTAAIRHALAADDFETAADIIEPMAETIVRMREARMLQKWLDAMPEQVILSRPVLLLYRALLLIDDSRFKQLSKYLDQIERLSSDEEKAGQSLMLAPVYQGRIMSLRALLAGLRFDFGKARHLAETSLELMEGQTCAFKMLSLVITGGMAYIDGKPDEARRVFLLLKRLLREMDSLTLEYCALGVLYCLEIPLGNLRLIEAMVDETMAEHDKNSAAGEHDPAYGLLLILKSVVFYERYQLDEAEQCLIQGIRLSKNFMPRIVVALGYIVLSYVFMSKEKWDDALNAMETSEQLFPVITFPVTFVAQMLKGQVYLAANDLAAVAELLDIKKFNEDLLLAIYEKMGVITYYQTLAQYLIAAGKADEAIPLLERIEAQSGHHGYKVLIIKTMQAMAHYALDDLAAVADAVMWALTAAAPEGYIRVFVDAGPSMAEIFDLLQRDGHFEDPSIQTFANEVMAHLRKKYPAKFKSDEFVISGDDAGVTVGKEKSGSVAVTGLVPWTYQLDPVSEREIEVLELIAQGLNNKEIAEKLYISVNTVKTHVSKILSKLGVKNRTAAVSTAREIGLIKIL